MGSEKHIYLSVPLMNEAENLSALLDCLAEQKCNNAFTLVACVNQPENYWDQDEKVEICVNNQSSIEILTSESRLNVVIIDKSSKGKGWIGKKHGVGHARKTAMEHINSIADKNDLMVNMDGDTFYPPEYLSSLVEMFEKYSEAHALANPYYHRLTGKEAEDKAILRYEIYMRYFALNMLHTQNPYAFTAVGSSMSNPVWAYRKIGGITPKLSGEDFYFIQKMKKNGSVLISNRIKTYPAARFSDRVFFGTGPAMIKGDNGDWESYPLYPYAYFEDVSLSLRILMSSFETTQDYPMKEFLESQFGTGFLEPLRKNSGNEKQFRKFCLEKVDGLRILQYLKDRQKQEGSKDEYELQSFMKKYYSSTYSHFHFMSNNFNFATSSVEELNELRDLLVDLEDKLSSEVIELK
jgi:glycosyltransferase involved in cell wall biosynthesis